MKFMEEQTKNEMNNENENLPFDMGDSEIPSDFETKEKEDVVTEPQPEVKETVQSNEVPHTNTSYQSSPQSQKNQSYTRSSNSYNNSNNQSKGRGDDFKNTVSDYAVSMYQYACNIKTHGHSSVADLMFKDLMRIVMAANTASDAIGREKFIAMLEEGYYASSRMMEYMKFLYGIGVSGNMYEPLMENNVRIHRVFGASLKTTRSKRQNVSVGM